ncbi:hypothetical protein BYT27DRAFT_6552013 [Phlegmacium glaucopus]|nr:hypothetical protein BYT27DRAFT_6552013 [Phlegmacium glaucopus]
MPWKFRLFVSCATMSYLPRRYTPTSDFSVWFGELDVPLIITEVISNNQDRYHTLLQAIALARLVFQLCRARVLYTSFYRRYLFYSKFER